MPRKTMFVTSVAVVLVVAGAGAGPATSVLAGDTSRIVAGPPAPWCNQSSSHKVAYPILNIQCQGMSPAPRGVTTKAECEAACCGDPKCNTWLYNDGDTKVKGYCWLDDGPCAGPPTNGWVGGSTFPPPPPPPPSPPPPPPNGLREIVFDSDDSCASGGAETHMSVFLGKCYELLPYPSDPPHDKTAGVTLTAAEPNGLNGSNFTLSRFTTTTCQGSSLMANETIRVGVCHNRSVTPGAGVMAWMWVTAYIPPP